MITRRRLMRNLSGFVVGSQLAAEYLLARRPDGDSGTNDKVVWLDSNENPLGPPPSAIKAIVDGAAATARYHFDEFAGFSEALARSEELQPEQVLFGVGSTEVIDAAICAFTSSSIPIITATPTYDIFIELAQSLGRKVVQAPLTDAWGFPVRKLAAEAERAGASLIYLCNPNNPTSSLTPKNDIEWLMANLPPRTVLLVDEAYIHFAESTEIESAMKYVRQNRNVIVTRTFSKIYGMAGARAGFGCARPDLILAMKPFMDKVIPILALRAASAALADRGTLVPTRKASIGQTRRELCGWLQQKGIKYIEPHANFLMISIGRDARSFGKEMLRHGIAVGRPFPPLNEMIRVTIGTDPEMKRFREAFW